MTKWKSLTSKSDYKAAVSRINELMDVKRIDAVHNELNLLSFLVEEYEEKFHTMPDASPLEVIRFSMEMKGIKQQALIPILGSKGNVSKILSGKANIQLKDIQPLSLALNIPVEALIPKNRTYKEAVNIGADYVAEPENPIHKSLSKTPHQSNSKSYRNKKQTPISSASRKTSRKRKG